jgi:hypothetical protein
MKSRILGQIKLHTKLHSKADRDDDEVSTQVYVLVRPGV